MSESTTTAQVAANPYDGCMWVSKAKDGDVVISVLVSQQVYKGMKAQYRLAELTEGVTRMLNANFQPGRKLGGKIVVKQQSTPVDEDDINLYMLKDSTGNPVKDINGDPVWLASYYTEDMDDQDEVSIDLWV